MIRTRKKQSKPMDANKIGQISSLLDRGMTTKEISEVMERSLTSIRTYTKIIEAARSGNKVYVNPQAYKEEAVRLWCQANGYKVPETEWDENEPEIKAEFIQISDTSGYEKETLYIANAINNVAVQLHTLAEYLIKDLKGEEK